MEVARAVAEQEDRPPKGPVKRGGLAALIRFRLAS